MARNKHPEQTVQLILETAARLFAQKGYDETSMQDIMDATHLSKGAIYHHFPSKLDILLRIADQILMVNEDMLGKDPGPEGAHRGGEAPGALSGRLCSRTTSSSCWA